MGNEIEVKWVLSCNDESIKKKLGYDNLTELKLSNPNQIISNLEKILTPKVKYTENIVALDQFYWPIAEFKPFENQSLRYYANGLYLDNRKILSLTSKAGNEIEALNLIELINSFNSTPELEPFKRQLRIRHEQVNLEISTYLTAKQKIGLGDEENVECEVQISANQDLTSFFNSIGYRVKNDRKKTKRKTKFSGHYLHNKIPITTNVEIVKIDELLTLEFLEIEMLPEIKTNNKDLLDVIYSLAKELGVENNRIENRGYQVLQNILTEK